MTNGNILLGVSIGLLLLFLGGSMIQSAVYQNRLMAHLSADKIDILNGQEILADRINLKPAPSPSIVPSPPPIDCEVAIIGAGAGGLTIAYRLAKIYGSRLCIFDDRKAVGGKIQSKRYVASSDTRPVWTPTHAEQLRGGDAIMRCLAQEVGTIMVVRGTPGTFFEVKAKGINATAYQCFGSSIPTGPAECDTVSPWESVLAPNGEDTSSPYGNDLPNPCGAKDWRSCSYTDEYFKMLLSASNVNTITQGESLGQYIYRILGVNGGTYFSEMFGYSYLNDQDARLLIEHFNYDNTFAYGAIHMAHGAPQVGTWNRVAKLLISNGTRIFLNHRIQSMNTNSNGNYVLLTSGTSPTTITAKRLVMAFPPSHINSMSGSVADTLRQSPYVSFAKPIHACTWNAFFPTRWWKKHTSTCNIGYCATGSRSFNLSGYARENFMAWNYQDATPSATRIDFIQYVPTPERKEGNLLRYFFEQEACDTFDAIYASSGALGVQKELMSRTRVALSAAIDKSIPDPVEAYYSSEKFAYASFAPGAPFTASQLSLFAAEPMPGKKICFASEGFNILDWGWQEGAAKSAHNCLKGNVFNDVISNSVIQSFERCRANISSGANRYLDIGNKNSGNDACLLLRNEYHMRDLANYTTCGSPKVYDYPNLASFTSTSYQPDQLLWQNAVTTAVYEPSANRFRVGRHF